MDELFRRRRLPHYDKPGATYFITGCLEGSIPASGLLEIARYRAELERRQRPEDISEKQWTVRRSKLIFARTDEWLDGHAVVKHLSDERLARIVADACYFFAGSRYDYVGLCRYAQSFSLGDDAVP